MLCAGVILYAGSQLTHHADAISDKTGLGRSWIGLILLATITSLPELITGISAIMLNDLPDMAISGTIGSCVFNLMVISILDFMSRERPVLHIVHEGHIISAGFGIFVLGLASVDMLFGKYLGVVPWLQISPISMVSAITYFIAMRLIYTFETDKSRELIGGDESKAQDGAADRSLASTIFWFALHAILIVGAACYLPSIGEEIVKITGWGETFIGASFIAITTSLPEITVSVAAARMTAFDMAVANLLGSNLFNVFIIQILDLFYRKGPILHSVSAGNILMALAAIISTAVVVIGLIYRSERKFFIMAGDAAVIMIISILANVLLFIMAR